VEKAFRVMRERLAEKTCRRFAKLVEYVGMGRERLLETEEAAADF